MLSLPLALLSLPLALLSLPPALLSFDRPLAFLVLLALVPLLALMIRTLTSLRLRRARFADFPALGRMAVSSNEGEILLRMTLTMAALALGVLALAGPRWGGSLGSLQPGEVPALVVALDVSQSMLADDVDGGRIDRARAVMTEILEGLPSWKVGMVAFADEAQVFCPVTSDSRALITLAQRARPGSELKPGSNLEVALNASLKLLGKRPGAILLLTDGEELAGDASRAVRALKDAGVLLVTLGVGTEQGGKIPSGSDLFGQPIFRTYRGALVTSRLNERGLKALAAGAGGHYLDAASPAAAPRTLQLIQERWGTAKADEGGALLATLPLLLCFLLLVAEAAFSARRRLSALGSLSFRRVLETALKRSGNLIVLAALTQIAWTWPWEGVLTEAARSYGNGDYPAATARLEQAVSSRDADPRLWYDLGCSRYQGEDYGGAAIAFKKALGKLPDSSKLRPWAHYNLGNALVRQSERAQKAKPLLEAAAEEYEKVLQIDPRDEDARHNLELVQARLADDKGGAKPDPSRAGNKSARAGVFDLPAPDQAEIGAMLDALEHDERQRQMEASQAQPKPPATAGDLMRQLLRQPPEGSQSDHKDW